MVISLKKFGSGNQFTPFGGIDASLAVLAG
jgi:hypothetical protein